MHLGFLYGLVNFLRNNATDKGLYSIIELEGKRYDFRPRSRCTVN